MYKQLTSYVLLILLLSYQVLCYSHVPTQYHIQTDRGPNRYFRYQTYNGQFRREKRFEDGKVIGTYGWVDPTGLLRIFDYIADSEGYRIVRKRFSQVSESQLRQINNPPTPAPPPQKIGGQQNVQLSLPSRTSPNINNYNKRRPPVKSVSPLVQKHKNNSERPYLGNKRVITRDRSKYQSVRNRNRQKVERLKPTTVGNRQEPQNVYKEVKSPDNAQPVFDKSVSLSSLGYDNPGGRVTIDYDIGNQYRKEKIFPSGVVIGEHGYVDPLGILRVTRFRADSAGKKEYKWSAHVGTRNAYSS